MSGTIYILTNEAMPGYVKIGMTTNQVERRMTDLDTTSVPLPFECFYAAKVENMQEAEKLLHDAFADHRVRARREFFRISPERVASALKLSRGEDVTPKEDIFEDRDDERALNVARERRGRFNFRVVDIPAGAILTHVKDENVTCEVLDDRRVRFENEEMSLSKAALMAVNKMGYTWKAVSGPMYWEYEGRTLDEIRLALEDGG